MRLIPVSTTICTGPPVSPVIACAGLPQPRSSAAWIALSRTRSSSLLVSASRAVTNSSPCSLMAARRDHQAVMLAGTDCRAAQRTAPCLRQEGRKPKTARFLALTSPLGGILPLG